VDSEQPGPSGRRGIAPGVDLDLLADYAGGALEGTPEQVRASALVASEPAWADALESLRVADAMVRADLARLADSPEPLPGDIATRLDRALHQARPHLPESHADLPDSTVPGNVDLAEVRAGRLKDRPGTDRSVAIRDEPADLRVARLRRRFRIAAAAGVAAGLLALAVPAGYLVLGQNGLADSREDMAATEGRSDTGAPEATSDEGDRRGAGALGAGYPVPVTASGTDYARDSLLTVQGLRAGAARTVPRAPEGLSRLLALPALDDCLTAIRSAHPGTVTIVDYARFEGAPALIVAITATSGSTRVVVAGPDCGRSGTDERYTTAR
jgi:hypothetical protein